MLSLRDVGDDGREESTEEGVEGFVDFVTLVDFSDVIGTDGEWLSVDFLELADDAVGVDGSGTDEGAQEIFREDHTILQGAEEADVILLLDGDAVQVIGERIDNNVNIVELRSDRGRAIQTRMLAPHDMYNIIPHMTLLVDLLGVVAVGGHPGDVMEDHLKERVAVVWSAVAGGALAIQASHEASVRGQVHLPTKTGQEASEFGRAGVVGQDRMLVFLAWLDVDDTDLHDFPPAQFIELLQ